MKVVHVQLLARTADRLSHCRNMYSIQLAQHLRTFMNVLTRETLIIVFIMMLYAAARPMKPTAFWGE